MWIFNEEQFVPHCLLSISLQKYDDTNYLWLGNWSVDTAACYTKVLLPHIVLTHFPSSASAYCLMFYIENIRPLRHEILFFR